MVPGVFTQSRFPVIEPPVELFNQSFQSVLILVLKEHGCPEAFFVVMWTVRITGVVGGANDAAKNLTQCTR
jgi:hypothetical protein